MQLAKSKLKKLTLAQSGLKRMSGDVMPSLDGIAAEMLARLGERAGSLARAFGRKTIMTEDVIQACKQLFPNQKCEKIANGMRATKKGDLKKQAPAEAAVEPTGDGPRES